MKNLCSRGTLLLVSSLLPFQSILGVVMRNIILKTRTDQIMSKNTQWHWKAMGNIKLLSRPYGAICPEHLLISPVPDVPTICTCFPQTCGSIPGLCSLTGICLECPVPAFLPGEFWLIFQQCALVFITPFCMALRYLLAFLSFPLHLKLLQGMECNWFNFILSA